MKGNFHARFLGGRGRVNRLCLPGPTSHTMPDTMVTPHCEREAGSAPGAFYTVKDFCITCSLPVETAPENIRYHERPCTSCPSTLINHCLVVRQPETPEELDQMIEVVAGSCVEAYRYCGTDPEILRRLVEAGCKEQCDSLVRRKHDDVG